MTALIINPTDETPGVNLDPEKGILEISGKSLPEDVTSFYAPVLKWIADYQSAPKPETQVHFKFNYFNTASSKLILDILFKIEEIAKSGKKVAVKWYCHEEDEDMEEAGVEYSELVEVPFEIVKFN